MKYSQNNVTQVLHQAANGEIHPRNVAHLYE